MPKPGKFLLTTLLASVTTVAAAAPVGYSINSDSPSDYADSLYRIDLATGDETWIAPVFSFGEARIDVEGLAFASDGILWGLDESSMTLFPLNPETGLVRSEKEVFLSSDPAYPGEALPSQGNDFGMTFTCDGSLYFTSVAKGALYRLELDGSYRRIGSDNSLGSNIGALAAWGDTLYGLGNGLDGSLNTDEPAIFEIDTATGVATKRFDLPSEVDPYAEGGLSFDDEGNLWAITDRRDKFGAAQPSQILKIDVDTGTVTEYGNNTSESGFESLAVTVPRGCTAASGAQFKVQKQFVDGNDSLPTTLGMTCNSGLPLEQSVTVQPGEGIDVTFTVTDFQDGELDCTIRETTPAGYIASYDCFSDGSCTDSATACSFTDASSGQDNLCVIRNYPEAVEISVEAEWVLSGEETVFEDDAVAVDLVCRNIVDGDGEWSRGEMSWSWIFYSDTPAQTANVQPGTGNSECRTIVSSTSSHIESASSCENWTPVLRGDSSLSCLIVNTEFFEGIPTLSRSGLLLASILLLLTGLFATRRF